MSNPNVDQSNTLPKNYLIIGASILAVFFCIFGPLAIWATTISQKRENNQEAAEIHSSIKSNLGINNVVVTEEQAAVIKENGKTIGETQVSFNMRDLDSFEAEFPSIPNQEVSISASIDLSNGLYTSYYNSPEISAQDISRIRKMANNPKLTPTERIPYFYMLEVFNMNAGNVAISTDERLEFARLLLNNNMASQATTRFKAIRIGSGAPGSHTAPIDKDSVKEFFNELPPDQQKRAKAIWPPYLIP